MRRRWPTGRLWSLLRIATPIAWTWWHNTRLMCHLRHKVVLLRVRLSPLSLSSPLSSAVVAAVGVAAVVEAAAAVVVGAAVDVAAVVGSVVVRRLGAAVEVAAVVVGAAVGVVVVGAVVRPVAIVAVVGAAGAATMKRSVVSEPSGLWSQRTWHKHRRERIIVRIGRHDESA